MRQRNFWCSVLTLLFLSIPSAYPLIQDAAADTSAPAAPKPPKPQFFAGQVIEADASQIKVARTLLGRAPETRVFVIDGKTKTPKGGIKVKSRVTVRYEHMTEHDLALEIQVRPLNRMPKAS